MAPLRGVHAGEDQRYHFATLPNSIQFRNTLSQKDIQNCFISYHSNIFKDLLRMMMLRDGSISGSRTE